MPELTGTVLDVIARKTFGRYRDSFARFDPDSVVRSKRAAPLGLHGFLERGFGLVAEIKNASPSLGNISDELTFEERLRAYEEGGAGAVSILTEPVFFGGSVERLDRAREMSALPLLRKDFIIHPYMVYEAYLHGADWVLLIAALLNDDELECLYSLCRSLGIVPLLEVHNRYELDRVLTLGPDFIGINNRDLHSFKVSGDTCFALRPFVPDHIPVLAESGIASTEDVRKLKGAGFCGALIGASLMSCSRPAQLLREWLES